MHELLNKAINYNSGDAKRIAHLIKVYTFTDLICEGEEIKGANRDIILAAAILHDIGIRKAQKIYGSCEGKYQEKEGVIVARKMMKELNYEPAIIERIAYLIAHHHHYPRSMDIDLQILVEADFLVNAQEEHYDKALIRNSGKQLFKTRSGKQLLNTLFEINRRHKKVELYIVRHGQTLFNIVGRMQGWSDSPLSDLGKKQATALGLALKGTYFNQIIASSASRALDTAALICPNREIMAEPLLKEMSFGEAEGSQIEGKNPQMIKQLMENGWLSYGGESKEVLEARILKALMKIGANANDHDRILIVTHGAVMMHLYGLFHDKSYFETYSTNVNDPKLKKNPIRNCSLTRFDYIDDHLELIEFGDDSYLNTGLKLLEEAQ